MVTHAHKQIIEALVDMDRVPDNPVSYNTWIRAPRHLDYLQTNATKDELIVYASGPYSFIHSVAIPAEALVDKINRMSPPQSERFQRYGGAGSGSKCRILSTSS
jgi:hypothetical protein